MVQGKLFAVQGAGGICPLGHLTWYTVPSDLKVTRQQMEDAFINSGISTSKMPDPIRPHDAFRRATSRVKKERIPVPGMKDIFYNTLVREIRCDNQEVLRHLVIETVDAQNAVLTYQEVAAFRFCRITDNMNFSYLTSPDPNLYQLIDDIRKNAEDKFRQYVKYYAGNHIRRMMIALLNNLSPTLVRPSGAVYFVPQKYEDDVMALQNLSKNLGAEFITLPVIDAENAREMVLNAFKKQTVATIHELTEALKEPDITAYRIGSLMNQAKELLAQVREYEGLLQNKLMDLQSHVEIVQLQMKRVLSKVAA
jgi:hypothetical protein